MKKLIFVVLLLLLLAWDAWAVEPITHKIDILTPQTGTQWQNEVYKPCMERSQGSNSECLEECTRTQFSVDLNGNPIISKPVYWQIQTILLDKANEFLKANPEWEPFGVTEMEVEVMDGQWPTFTLDGKRAGSRSIGHMEKRQFIILKRMQQ